MSTSRLEAPWVTDGPPPPGADAPAPEPRIARRLRPLVPSLVPGLIMLVVGLIRADRPVLSWDEVATADVAGRSAGQIWHLLHTVDGVFGTYYLFMHLWTSAVGSTVLDLRLPSILAMAGTVAVTAELGRRLFNPVTGFLAGLLLCLIPSMSRYAEEARPYAIASLLSMVATLLLYRALDRPGPARWIAYGLTVVGLGLSHVVALTVLGAHLVIVGSRSRGTGSRRPLTRWAATAGVALLLLLPVIWLGLRQRPEQLYWVPPMTLRSIYAFPERIAGSAAAGWLLLGLIAGTAGRPVRSQLEMMATAAVPLAIVAAVSAVGPSFWVTRYLLIVVAPAAIVAAAGLERLGPRASVDSTAVRLLAVCALFAVAAAPGQLAVRGRTAKNGSDYRSAAALVHRYQQPGDDIVYTPGSRTLRAGINYYLRRDPGRPRDVLLVRSAAAAGSLRATESADPVARIGGAKRIWVLLAGVQDDPTTVRSDLTPLLRGEYRRIRLWHVKRATLALFIRRDPAVR